MPEPISASVSPVRKTLRLLRQILRPIALLLPIALMLGACGDGDQPPAEVATGHLEVRALYSKDGPAADDARFLVDDEEGERVTGPTSRTGFDLAPGRYKISATTGEAQTSAEAEVKAEERTDMELVLDAGVLHLQTLLAEGGPESTGARYRILGMEENIRGERETITGPTSRSEFVLPAGTFLVRAEDGEAHVEQEIKVEAGERNQATLLLDAGVLQARAVGADGAEITEGLRWQVLAAKEDIRGRRETIAGPTSRSKFVLPAGQHLLQAQAGDRVARELITVEAGARLEARITMPEAAEEPEEQ